MKNIKHIRNIAAKSSSAIVFAVCCRLLKVTIKQAMQIIIIIIGIIAEVNTIIKRLITAITRNKNEIAFPILFLTVIMSPLVKKAHCLYGTMSLDIF
ncbi:MAG: hypothetical protein IKK42_00630 [Oscillospiraceae bacterium]|nr:hypothetical protein [Oscillospiraceae bacterium]